MKRNKSLFVSHPLLLKLESSRAKERARVTGMCVGTVVGQRVSPKATGRPSEGPRWLLKSWNSLDSAALFKDPTIPQTTGVQSQALCENNFLMSFAFTKKYIPIYLCALKTTVVWDYDCFPFGSDLHRPTAINSPALPEGPIRSR